MSTSASQVARLLSLVPYLQRNQGVRLTAAAAEFGVTPAQLRSDLGVLYMCGLPGLLPGDLIEIDMEAVDGEGVIFLSNADFLDRPLRLRADEVLPLILGLQAVREVAAAEVVTVVDSALAKLQRLAGDSGAAADRVAVRVRSAGEQVRAGISRALTEGRRLRLEHDSPRSGRSLRRVVDPHGLRVENGSAYLDAWSEAPENDPDSRPGWRSFRLDRVSVAEVLDEPVRQHDGEPDTDSWGRQLGESPLVTLELQPAAAWVAEYFPVEEVRPGEHGLEVCLRVADPAWFRGLLLRLGGAARVLSPAGAAEGAHLAAEEALARYR